MRKSWQRGTSVREIASDALFRSTLKLLVPEVQGDEIIPIQGLGVHKEEVDRKRVCKHNGIEYNISYTQLTYAKR
jgi:hypothetical protein